MQCKSRGKNPGNKKVERTYTIAKTKYGNLKWKHNKKA